MNEQTAPEATLPDAALLIDWENIKFSLAQRGMTPSIAAMRDACEQFGRVVLARAYADWQQPGIREDPRDLYAAGIEPVYVPVRRYAEEQGPGTVKNSVDVRLAVDCIELIHTHPQIGLFVLASGDQDFLHVVNRLRPYGKRVVGLAVSWSASPRLAERVDHMIFYDREIDPVPQVEEAPPTTTRAPVDTRLQTAAASIARTEDLDEGQVEVALNAVIRALREYRESNREMTLSVMGIELQRVLDAQSFRLVVRGRLQRIARELDRLGLLRIVRRGVDDWLYLGDETPPVSAEQSAEHVAPAPPRGAPRWEDLGAEIQQRAIAAVSDLASDARLDWLTFNRIAERLEWPDSPWTGREVGNAMTHAEVLVRDEERNWYDSFTGNVGTFWTLKLNEDHEAVRALIGVGSAASGED